MYEIFRYTGVLYPEYSEPVHGVSVQVHPIGGVTAGNILRRFDGGFCGACLHGFIISQKIAVSTRPWSRVFILLCFKGVDGFLGPGAGPRKLKPRTRGGKYGVSRLGLLPNVERGGRAASVLVERFYGSPGRALYRYSAVM
jgi:hypothetical protein